MLRAVVAHDSTADFGGLPLDALALCGCRIRRHCELHFCKNQRPPLRDAAFDFLDDYADTELGRLLIIVIDKLLHRCVGHAVYAGDSFFFESQHRL